MSNAVESHSDLNICYSLIPYTANKKTLLLRRYVNGSIVIDESHLLGSMKAIEGAIRTVREEVDIPINNKMRANRKKKINKKQVHEYTCVGIDDKSKIKFRFFLFKNKAELLIPIIGSKRDLALPLSLTFKERVTLFFRGFLKNKIFIAIKDSQCDEVVNFLNGHLVKGVM
jgi:hypothetical protein